jgi:hypothetical protein
MLSVRNVTEKEKSDRQVPAGVVNPMYPDTRSIKDGMVVVV